jgi:hypothetical protein
MLAALNLHSGKLILFVVLSILDLIFTCQLVQNSDGLVYESNPVASAWLAKYGWAGLVIFKAGMVALIGLTALLISIHRPKTSGRLLLFACTVTAGVVAYSFYLSQVMAGGPVELKRHDARSLQDDTVLLQMLENKQHYHAYQDLINQLSEDLSLRRLTLAEAIDRLARASRKINVSLARIYHTRYPGLTEREYLALHLIDRTLEHLDPRSSADRQTARQLAADYEEIFGKPIPMNATALGRRVEWYAWAH